MNTSSVAKAPLGYTSTNAFFRGGRYYTVVFHGFSLCDCNKINPCLKSVLSISLDAQRYQCLGLWDIALSTPCKSDFEVVRLGTQRRISFNSNGRLRREICSRAY